MATAAAPRPKPKPFLLRPAAKALVFAICLLPFIQLGWGAVSAAMGSNALGANPAETLIRATGDWTLRFLCITLTVTPARKLLNLPALARFRRMFGLYTFFYVCLHFICYAWFDKELVWVDIVRDIAKRPFILVGTAALVLMMPLAATSFNSAIKALGGKRWQALHRTIYAIVLLGLLHFFWMRSAKHNYAEVAVYGAIIAVLLGWRVADALRSAWRRRTNAAAAAAAVR